MEHEENCPWLKSEQNSSLIHTLPKSCQNRKCAIWNDLKEWFGYLGKSLSLLAIQEIYRDVAHEGSGVYERMAIEGGNILREVVELQAMSGTKEDLYLKGVSKLVFGKATESYVKFVKQLQLQKMSDLVNDTMALCNFARLYLAGAQTLTSPRSVANYLRVCVAFSVNEIAGPSNHSPTAEWIVPLIQHIYHSKRFRHLQYSCDNLLLTNLHMYMGYTFKELLPRIKECFDNLQNTPQMYYTDETKADEFAKTEANNFLNSRAIELFSCVHMKLHLTFLNENLNVLFQRSLRDTRTIFINLLGACWSISQKESRKLWLSNLFQTLRQIQLSTMAYFSGTTLTAADLELIEFTGSNLARDKFELLLNPKNLKLKDSRGAMSQDFDHDTPPYKPFSSQVKDENGKEFRRKEEFGKDSMGGELMSKEALVKLGGSLLEAYGYVQEFVVDNAYKLIQNSCFTPVNTNSQGEQKGGLRTENSLQPSALPANVLPGNMLSGNVLPGNMLSGNVLPANVLPLNVRYEEASDMAHIKIPLGKIASANKLEYRTLLKNKDRKLMELSINNFDREFPSFCVKVPTKK
uniref:Uncharacterized protein n=1 Tax=Theileria parva TaxID=5875 RepID=Q4MYJ4_THEPA|eukprot:XP_762971.1 hypothetical protein [Theileria parva strain Muguga]